MGESSTLRAINQSMKKKVAIICGGYSSESVVSFQSGETIYKHIDQGKYEPYIVQIIRESWSVLIGKEQFPIDKNSFTFTHNGVLHNFDVAFITIHGTPGEDGKLQGYFDTLPLPYINSGVLASALTFNKWACNAFLRSFGFKTAVNIYLYKDQNITTKEVVQKVGIPCFIKPNDSGSSFGITKVNDADQVQNAIHQAFTEGEDVIIESFLDGTEVTCGAYSDGEQIHALLPTEIVAHGDFFDFEAKYEGTSDEITPARITDAQKQKVQSLTKKIFKLLGLKGITRIDYILIDNEYYLIEVNTTPGMSAASIVPQQMEAMGSSKKELFDAVLGAVV